MNAFVGGLLALAVLGQQTSAAPSLLTDALKRASGLRLVDPTVDFAGLEIRYTAAELKEAGYWPPWIIRDLDRDGRDDVAAAVVRETTGGRLFGVAAVHARQPGRLVWVQPLSTQEIYSVGKGLEASDTLNALPCIKCDWNAWYRWSGRAYEYRLQAVGETVVVATAERTNAALRYQPSARSRQISEMEACAEAKVLRVGGAPGARWYLVESINKPIVQGWVPASYTDDENCLG